MEWCIDGYSLMHFGICEMNISMEHVWAIEAPFECLLYCRVSPKHDLLQHDSTEKIGRVIIIMAKQCIILNDSSLEIKTTWNYRFAVMKQQLQNFAHVRKFVAISLPSLELKQNIISTLSNYV